MKNTKNLTLVFLAFGCLMILGLDSKNNKLSTIHAQEELDDSNIDDINNGTLTVINIVKEDPYLSKPNGEELKQILVDYREQLRIEEEKKLEEERKERERQEYLAYLESITNYIYINTNDLTVQSDISANQFNKLFEGTGLAGTGQAYVDAQNIYGVNSVFLAALASHESGYGESDLAKTRNNVTGFQAYNYNIGAAKSFDSIYDCILATAKHLSENYLTPGGKYYSGLGVRDVNVRYCLQDDGSVMYSWSVGLEKLMYKFATQILEISSQEKEVAEAVTYVYFDGQQL